MWKKLIFLTIQQSAHPELYEKIFLWVTVKCLKGGRKVFFFAKLSKFCFWRIFVLLFHKNLKKLEILNGFNVGPCFSSGTLSYVWKYITKIAFGSTYLHQTFTKCVSNQCTHFFKINLPGVTASYGIPSKFIMFFRNFNK